MAALNAVLTRTFDAFLRPLLPLPAGLILAILSLLTAVAVLLVVRFTSNQQAVTAVKRQIHADFFEIRLFNDNLPAMLGAAMSVIRHDLTYLRLSLVPMLWMIVPFVFVVSQLHAYFGYSGVDVSQPVLVTAQMKSSASTSASLEQAAGIRDDTPVVWIPALQQLAWRVVPDRPGDHVIRLKVLGEVYEKTLHVSEQVARRSPIRPSSLIDQVAYPSEPPLPASGPISSITVSYPERRIFLLGWDFSWLFVYFAESILFVMLLSRAFGVSF